MAKRRITTVPGFAPLQPEEQYAQAAPIPAQPGYSPPQTAIPAPMNMRQRLRFASYLARQAQGGGILNPQQMRAANVASANLLADNAFIGQASLQDVNTRANDMNAANVGQIGSSTRYNDALTGNVLPAQGRLIDAQTGQVGAQTGAIGAETARYGQMTAPLVQQEQTRAEYAPKFADEEIAGRKQTNTSAGAEETRRQQMFDAQLPTAAVQPFIPAITAAMNTPNSIDANPAVAPFMQSVAPLMPQAAPAPLPTVNVPPPAPLMQAAPTTQPAQQQPSPVRGGTAINPRTGKQERVTQYADGRILFADGTPYTE